MFNLYLLSILISSTLIISLFRVNIFFSRIIIFLYILGILYFYSHYLLPGEDLQEYLERAKSGFYSVELIYYFLLNILISDTKDFFYMNILSFWILFTSLLYLPKQVQRKVLFGYVVYSTSFVFMLGVLNINRQFFASNMFLIFLLYLPRMSSFFIMLATVFIHKSTLIFSPLLVTKVGFFNNRVFKGIFYLVLFLFLYVYSKKFNYQLTGADFSAFFFFFVTLYAFLSDKSVCFGSLRIIKKSHFGSNIFYFFSVILFAFVITSSSLIVERLFYFIYLIIIVDFSLRVYDKYFMQSCLFLTIANLVVAFYLFPMKESFL